MKDLNKRVSAMLLKTLIKPKKELTTVKEDCTLEEALHVLEDSGYRCVPILDESGKIFRGNIYKMHIYRHKSRGGDMNLPVTYLLKNATKFVSINSAFFNVFFSIKDLPYITVLDRGDLVEMSKIITKYTSIASCMTLDVQQGEFVRRTMFTLPADVSREKLETIVKALEKKNFKVPEIEDLQI